MKNIIITTAALLLTSSFAANAQPPRAVLEDGREATAAMLTLPSAINGALSIQGCTACKRVDLTLDRSVQFFIGKREVSFADLKRHLLENPKANVLVVSPINKSIVTRISASVPDVK